MNRTRLLSINAHFITHSFNMIMFRLRIEHVRSIYFRFFPQNFFSQEKAQVSLFIVLKEIWLDLDLKRAKWVTNFLAVVEKLVTKRRFEHKRRKRVNSVQLR